MGAVAETQWMGWDLPMWGLNAMSKSKKVTLSSVTRNAALWRLNFAVDDELVLQIFSDFARLIRRSEKACDKAARVGPDYAEAVGDSEADYLEEIIGASFLLLQAKIRRVCSATERLRKFAKSQYNINLGGLDQKRIMSLEGPFKGNRSSLVEVVWAVGNYYKHRDEWSPDVWRNKKVNEKEENWLRQARATRREVEGIGIVQFSTGNMRTAYEYFGVDPYSKCERLAQKVHAWSRRVYKEALRQVKNAENRGA